MCSSGVVACLWEIFREITANVKLYLEIHVGNVVPQHYSLTSDCLIKSHSKKVTPITVPKAALVSSEAKNLYIEYIYC